MKRKYTKKSRKHFRKKSRKYIRKNKMKKTTKKFRKMKGGVVGFPRAQVRARVADVRKHYIYKTTQPNVPLYSYRRSPKDNAKFFLLKQTEGSNQVMVEGIKNDDGNLKFIHNGTEVPKTEETMAETGSRLDADFFFGTYQNKDHLDNDDTLIEIRQPGGRLAGNHFIPINVIEYVESNYD